MIWTPPPLRKRLLRPSRSQRGWIMAPHRFAAHDPNAIAVLNSLIGWWDMNDNAANAVIADASGHGNHLEIRGGYLTSSYTQTGVVGAAQRISNTSTPKFNHQFPTHNNTLLDFTGDVSFTAWGWFKSTASTNPNFEQQYFGCNRASGAADGGWGMRRTTSAATMRSYISISSTTAVVTTAIAITPTSWNFLAFRYDAAADVVSCRVNTTTNTATAAGGVYAGANPSDFTIGRSQPRSTGAMDTTGTTADFDVDAFAACNVALSDATLDYLYNGGAGKSYAQVVAD